MATPTGRAGGWDWVEEYSPAIREYPDDPKWLVTRESRNGPFLHYVGA